MNARITNLTGQEGGVVITDANTHTPSALPDGTTREWQAIAVIEQANISTISSNLTDDTGLTGWVIPAGVTLLGVFTSIKLTSGKVVAYFR